MQHLLIHCYPEHSGVQREPHMAELELLMSTQKNSEVTTVTKNHLASTLPRIVQEMQQHLLKVKREATIYSKLTDKVAI